MDFPILTRVDVVPLHCSCGQLRGRARGISGRRGIRVVCYCDDCQAFAIFLGDADRILDAQGGTEIFQMPPARLCFDAGAERLACMRLRPGGLLRWYAACCRTPVGNTLSSPQVPFVGVIHSILDADSSQRSREEVLGPVRARVHGRFAKGDRTPLGAHDKIPPAMLVPFLKMILVARLRGEHRPSPFFDAHGEPSARPQVLAAEELRRIEATRDAPG